MHHVTRNQSVPVGNLTNGEGMKESCRTPEACICCLHCPKS